MRWKQDPVTHKLIPVDEMAFKHDKDRGIIVRGNFDAFKSPIDGSVISNQREYDDHCKRHNVVNSQEFSPEYYQRKAAEREAVHANRLHPKEERRRRESLNEMINHLERQHG